MPPKKSGSPGKKSPGKKSPGKKSSARTSPYPVPEAPAALLQAAETTLPPFRENTVDHDYEILEEIGKGNYAAVTKIKHKETGELHAIKLLSVELILRSQKERIRVVREATLLKDFKHDNIVNLLESFRTETHDVGLILEYCSGGDLASYMKSNTLQPAHIRFAWKEITKGLAFLHDKQVVHRDIKPENILVSTKGQVKIADFGFARHIDAAVDRHTRNLTTCGTKNYLSPEGFWYKYDFKVDIWALGCTGYFLHTGKTLVAESAGLFEALEEIQNVFGDLPDQDYLTTGNTRVLKERLDENSVNAEGGALIDRIMQVIPERRPSADEIVEEPYLRGSLVKSLHEDPGVGDAGAAAPAKVYESDFLMVEDRFYETETETETDTRTE